VRRTNHITGGERRFEFEFTYNRKAVRAYEGDSIACALAREGVHVFSRSMKFHRPRGLYCGAGRCFSCAMRVDGIPGVRTCQTLARDGMVVESEGGIPTTRIDLLSSFDHIFRRQLDYHSMFTRPRIMAPLFQRIVRRLASPRRLPEHAQPFQPLKAVSTDVLIVGHGVSGRAACEALREKGLNPLVADRHGTDVFPPSMAFGFYESGRVGLMTDTGGMLVEAKVVLLATGRLETGLDLPNGDLPGVMLPEAAVSLAKRGIRPGARAFLVGMNGLREQVENDLSSVGCAVVGRSEDADKVKAIIGRRRVRKVKAVINGVVEEVLCDTVVVFGPLVPYVNLAQQAGCRLKASGDFWIVDASKSGATSVSGIYSCGSVAGYETEKDRAASGRKAGLFVARAFGGS
jgi:sarcosine oxidase subunit alpha